MALLRDWVFHNWHLKLLALLISFLLWSTYTSEPQAEVGYLAPLEFRNVPPNLEISGDVTTQVHIRLRGRSIVLRRVTQSDLVISVDLSGSMAGETLVRLTPDKLDVPLGAEVVRISPSTIRVQLAPRTSPH